MVPTVFLLLLLAFAIAGFAFYLREAKRKKTNKAEQHQRSE